MSKEALADQSISCQCPACEKTSHASDCAVHNAPAYPVGECDCGAQPYPENFIDALKYDVARRDSERAELTDWQERAMVAEAALARLLDAQQKPVKVGRITDNIKGMVLRQEVMLYTDDYLPIGTAVYTSPPAQREPLTDEQIGDLKGGYQSGRIGSFVELIRAIEAAHGIGEKK